MAGRTTPSCVSTPALLAALEDCGDELGQVLGVLRAAGEPEPEALSLGTGDRILLGVLGAVTGENLEVAGQCPHCETLNSAVVSPATVPPSAARVARLGRGGGLREPTYGDLVELPDGDAAELLRRCVVGTPEVAPSAAALELVDDALTGPLVLACTGCGEQVAIDLDVQTAVLARLACHAHVVDSEIHLLASAYHWSLSEIERLPDTRRATLARLVAGGA